MKALRKEINREKNFWKWWLLICLVIIAAATIIYFEPYLTSSTFFDKGHTATNMLISMGTSGIVLYIYHFTKVQQCKHKCIKNVCYFIILICLIVNTLLSRLATNIFLTYIMMLVTGVGTGGVAMLFSVYDKEIVN